MVLVRMGRCRYSFAGSLTDWGVNIYIFNQAILFKTRPRRIRPNTLQNLPGLFVLCLTMDTKTQNIINSNRELIIKDLHGDVFDDLLDKGVLSAEEYNDIITQVSNLLVFVLYLNTPCKISMVRKNVSWKLLLKNSKGSEDSGGSFHAPRTQSYQADGMNSSQLQNCN